MVRLYLATGFPEVAKCEEKAAEIYGSLTPRFTQPIYLALAYVCLEAIGIHGSLLNEIRGALFTDLCS